MLDFLYIVIIYIINKILINISKLTLFIYIFIKNTIFVSFFE